jgi:hypothetical protein
LQQAAPSLQQPVSAAQQAPLWSPALQDSVPQQSPFVSQHAAPAVQQAAPAVQQSFLTLQQVAPALQVAVFVVSEA